MLCKPNETKPVQMRSKFIFRMVGFLQGLTEINFETSSTVTSTSFYNSFRKDLSQTLVKTLPGFFYFEGLDFC